MARSVLGVLGRPRPAPDLGDLRRAQRRVRSGRAVRLSYRLSRPATLALTLRCVRTGRRGERGDNAIAISSQAIGRRAGLLRLEARASGSESTRSSGLRRVHVRITRKR